jgi:hypothetical protein
MLWAVPWKKFLVYGSGDVRKHASPNHSRASLNLIVEPGLYVLFSMHLRFLTIRRSKGTLIVTAALELSTNQITHFYSPAKNTSEMVKLLHRLVDVYADQECIYFSWDVASWHASKALYARVREINKGNGCPQVKLVPLPSSAQFLNVIESVFSGMARAIIHNSDFPSLEAAQAAIDKYFADRNEQFSKYPKRAGQKIWGNERVPSEFSVSHNCKDPKYR